MSTLRLQVHCIQHVYGNSVAAVLATLTNHCLYTVAHQHRQEAMVRRRPGAVDDVGKLRGPLQVDN